MSIEAISITPKQAASLIGVSAQTIRNHIAAGTLPAEPYGPRGHHVISPDAFCSFCHTNNYLIDRRQLLASLTMMHTIFSTCPHATNDIPTGDLPSWLRADC